uniref:Uncharacterized protein n=1 Tax=Utricularia reniformis TaxID=192314 RepID=A0A1Y0AZF3_9LAMI|nr:hypothetical protein AEK19_MT0232 [Utricularia reniformis]ART30511.1 hypothetical protein AEK19_MT0232 [Utricularia reniformis]
MSRRIRCVRIIWERFKDARLKGEGGKKLGVLSSDANTSFISSLIHICTY